MSLSHRCGGILAHSSVQNCFNSATLEGFQAWNDYLRSCHSISIRFEPGLWLDHSKTFLFYFIFYCFLEPFRGWLSGVFWIIVLLHNPCSLELTNWRPDNPFRIFWKSAEFMVPSIMASRPGPEGLSHYHHHVWLLVWCSFYEMLCWFYTWYNGTKTFQ